MPGKQHRNSWRTTLRDELRASTSESSWDKDEEGLLNGKETGLADVPRKEWHFFPLPGPFRSHKQGVFFSLAKETRSKKSKNRH